MIATVLRAVSPLALVLAITLVYVYRVAGHWSWAVLPDLALLALCALRPSYGIVALTMLMLAVRHVFAFAHEVAVMLQLDSFGGWSAGMIAFALPALDDRVMSEEEEEEEERRADTPVHVPVLGTPDTSAVSVVHRDITDNGLITLFLQLNDPKTGKPYTNNEIYKKIGGHRATVMNQIKATRSGLPAAFRTEAGDTAPATHPITGATP